MFANVSAKKQLLKMQDRRKTAIVDDLEEVIVLFLVIALDSEIFSSKH